MGPSDHSLREARKKEITVPKGFRESKMDDEAKQLLKDYVSLLCNRPFLSLASITSQGQLGEVTSNLAMAFCGAISRIETGAALISIRNNLNEIDRETMRETISFSEPKLRNLFMDIRSLQKSNVIRRATVTQEREMRIPSKEEPEFQSTFMRLQQTIQAISIYWGDCCSCSGDGRRNDENKEKKGSRGFIGEC